MADTQEAPQLVEKAGMPGSISEAQDAILGLLNPEEEQQEAQEEQPSEEEESIEETPDESSEEVPEEEEESEEEESEDEEESEEFDEEEEEALYAVRVDGEEQEVTLEELLKGYSRQSDYTKKTQDVANERREVEALQEQYNSEVAQIQAERQQYMEALTNIIQNSNMDQFANVDWNSLKENDPIEYVTKREEYREAQERIQGLQQQQAHAAQRQQHEDQLAHQRTMREEYGKLVEAIPEWSDEEYRNKQTASLRSYATNNGFTPEELNSLVDHRSILVLMKAQKYDSLQKADVKSKKLKNKPKVIRSGTGNPERKKSAAKQKRTEQMKRLKETGHVDDAAGLFEDFIDFDT